MSQEKQYQDIGRRIRLLREQAGMSQEELGKRIGRHSASAIYYIEQGARRLKVFDLIEIAKVLGVSLDMLLLEDSHGAKWSQPISPLPQKLARPTGNPVSRILVS